MTRLKLITAAAVMLLAPMAFSADLTVTTLADQGAGSLRQAIADAQSGDRIVFANGFAGQIVLTSGTLQIDKDLTIAGPGADELSIRGAAPVFRVSGNAVVSISGLALKDIYAITIDGAGIQLEAGTLTVSRCRFESLIGGNGGAIAVSTGTLQVRQCTFLSCGAQSGVGVAGSGGCIYNDSGTVEIADSTAELCFATDGAVVYSQGSSGVTLSGCLFYENDAIKGSVVYNHTATVEALECTFGANFAEAGGAIFNDAGTVSLSYCTYSANFTEAAGGAIFNDGGTVYLANTILANDYGGGHYAGANDAETISLGYNLCDNNDCSAFLTAEDDQNGVPAGLATDTPVDNGGLTYTIALSETSPAINAGDPNFVPPPYYDQRGEGYPRVRGGRIDIGAVEFQSAASPLAMQCPAPLTVECASPSGTPVTLTAIVTDTDGAVFHVTWLVDGQSAQSDDVPIGGASTSLTFTGSFGFGSHSVEVLVISDTGNQMSCSTSVTVEDHTVPVLVCPEDITAANAAAVPVPDPDNVQASAGCSAVTVTWLGDSVTASAVASGAPFSAPTKPLPPGGKQRFACRPSRCCPNSFSATNTSPYITTTKTRRMSRGPITATTRPSSGATSASAMRACCLQAYWRPEPKPSQPMCWPCWATC